MDDGITNELFDCPKGCGTLDYQSMAATFQDGIKGLIGKGLIIASIAILVAYIVWLIASGDGTNANLYIGQLFMVIIICVIILILGANIGLTHSAWNHRCVTCNGVLMDPKTVSEVFRGEAGTKIVSLMEEINVSDGDLNCPACGEKMGLLQISYTRIKHIQGDPLITFLITAGNLISEENLEIDVCNECIMLWFDGEESMRIEDSLSIGGA